MAEGSGRPAIGIDLGTTYSCAGVWRNNRVEIIANEQGNKTTPSCVAFTDTHRLIGEGAKYQATRNYKNTVYDVKRLIGRRFNDACVQKDLPLWPFKVISGRDDGKPKIVVQYQGERKEFYPEEISSFILSKMVDIAEKYIGSTVKEVVITVPAYFDEMQRQATMDAGAIAGLNVLHLMNEPTAAAMAYGFDKKPNKTILIFDLGGGTFDISIAQVKPGDIQVKATDGDTHLGGIDFDNNIVKYLVEEIKRKHGKDISGNAKAVRKLSAACERAKRTLSVEEQADIDVDSLYDDDDFSSTITRARFEALNMGLFRKCIDTVEKSLRDINMDKSQIHDVVLVGGSTKIPKIQSMLKEFFNREDLCSNINADEAVAYGAALQAAYLSNNKAQDTVLQDVTSLSFGIATTGNVFSVVIPRNTTIPTKTEKKYVTVEDNMRAIDISVHMGERCYSKDNIFLDKFTLTGIPPAPKGVSSITVCFEIDHNGILKVTAKDDQNIHNKMEVTIASENCRPRNEEIRRMIMDAKKYREDDENHRKNAKAKNDLENAIHELKNTIRADDNIKSKARKRIAAEIAHTEEWLKRHEKLADNDKFRCEYHQHVACLRNAVEISRTGKGKESSTLTNISSVLESLSSIFSIAVSIGQFASNV